MLGTVSASLLSRPSFTELNYAKDRVMVSCAQRCTLEEKCRFLVARTHAKAKKAGRIHSGKMSQNSVGVASCSSAEGKCHQVALNQVCREVCHSDFYHRRFPTRLHAMKALFVHHPYRSTSKEIEDNCLSQAKVSLSNNRSGS